MKPKFPPLWTWGTAFSLTLVLVFLFSSSTVIDLRTGYGANYESFTKRLANVKSTYLVKPEDKVVVIVGSSFTAMSIDHRPYFYERYKRERGGDLHVIKLYMFGSNAEHLQKLPDFFEALEFLHPDIVCLEEHLLAFDEQNVGQGNRVPWISDFRLGVNALKNRVFPSEEEEERNDIETFDFFWKYHQESYGADSLEVAASKALKARNYRSNERLNAWLNQYLSDSTQLVCLTIPRPAHIENVLTSTRADKAYQELQEAYQANFDIKYWTYQEEIPYRMFSGDPHLNAQGMRLFSDWLHQQIDKHLHP